jgi:hypothetical protein
MELRILRPNLTEVTIGDVTVSFSYRTPIAFHVAGVGCTARENVWGPTTGKHLRIVAPNVAKADRLDGEAFERALAFVLEGK